MSIEMINSTGGDFASTCPICNENPKDLHCPICDIELEGDSKNLRICKDCLLESFKSNDYVFQCPHCKKPLEIGIFIDMLSIMDIENIFTSIGKRIFDDIIFTDLSTKNNGVTLFNILTIDCQYILDNIQSIYRIYLMTLIESPEIPHISRLTNHFKSENFDSWWDSIKHRIEIDYDDYSTDKLEEEVYKYRNSKRKSLYRLPLKQSIESLKLRPYIIYQYMNLIAKNRLDLEGVSIEDIERKKNEIMQEFIGLSNDGSNCNQLLFKCSTECGGFVMSDYICNICNANYCRKCGLILDDNHTPELCKSNHESFKYILSTTQSCPKCAIRINKSEGCDVMFCTFCHICFSYKTGKELKGNLHNPHRLEWLKSMDKPATFNENENGVCIDVRNYNFNNLYDDPGLRKRMLELQDIINDIEYRIDDTSLYERVRNYIKQFMLPRYRLSRIDLLEIADMTFFSMRANDVYDRLHTLIDTIVDYMQYYSQLNELEYKDTLLMIKLDDFIDDFVIELIDSIRKLKLPFGQFGYFGRFSYKCERYLNRIENSPLYITREYDDLTKGFLIFKRICGENSPYNIVIDNNIINIASFAIHNNKKIVDSIDTISGADRPNIECIKVNKKNNIMSNEVAHMWNSIPNTFKAVYIDGIPYGLEPIYPFENGFDDESFEIYRSNDLWVGSLLNYIILDIYFGKPSNLPKLKLAKDINSYSIIQNNHAFDIDINEKESPYLFISPFRFYIDRPVLSNYSRLSRDIAHLFGCNYKDVGDLKKIKYLTFGIFIYIYKKSLNSH